MERVESEKDGRLAQKYARNYPVFGRGRVPRASHVGVSVAQFEKKQKVTAFIKTLKTVQPRKQLSFQKILAGIKDGSLFGFILCVIHTPETLKKLFEELPPYLKMSKSVVKILETTCEPAQKKTTF